LDIGQQLVAENSNTHLMASFGGKAWVSLYQKGKTVLSFYEARDGEIWGWW